MISLKLRGALKRKTYYCAFAKPFSACLLGSLGRRQFGSCRSRWKFVETGFPRIFPSFTGFAFLWVLLRSDVVLQKKTHQKSKNPNNHDKIRSMPIPTEAEVADVGR